MTTGIGGGRRNESGRGSMGGVASLCKILLIGDWPNHIMTQPSLHF